MALFADMEGRGKDMIPESYTHEASTGRCCGVNTRTASA